jgi:hypothetical protein
LKRLQDKPELLEALKNIEGFRSLNQEIETIINRSEAIKKAKKEDKEKDKKEKKELTEQEKEVKSLRKQVQENLLKLAARIPSFMYLTEYREQTLKDIITKLEPDLFKKVTGLDVSVFDALCEIGLFDPEKMNQGIFGFRRYESSSLNYAGIDMHEGEDVGGWDTVLKRQEFDELYANQQSSMTIESAILSAFNDVDEGVISVAKNIETNTTPAISASTSITQKYGIAPSKTSTDSVVQVPVQKPKEEIQVPVVNMGDTVRHKLFGEGTISFMDKAQKKIRVKFSAGEKVFVYPDAFLDKHLKVKE